MPKDTLIRWTHRVHEQTLPAVRATGGIMRLAHMVIEQLGYLDRSLRRHKLERDLRLIRLKLAEQPGRPFTRVNLGNRVQDLGQVWEAIDAFRRSLAGSDPADSVVRKLYALIASCHQQAGDLEQAGRL